MNYIKIYDQLIKRAENRLLEGYCERHHIIPRCMGGSNDINNISILTAEEHYVAHQLLIKIYPDETKLIYAAKMMTVETKYQSRSKNKLYGWLRKQFIESVSGKNSAVFGKTWEEIHGAEKAHEMRTNHPLKGRTYKEIHGHRAEEIRQLRIKNSTGLKRSPEFCKRMSTIAKNRPPMSDRVKSKISESTKGRIPWNKGKTTGHIPWNKGKTGGTWEEYYGEEKAHEMRTNHPLKNKTYKDIYGDKYKEQQETRAIKNRERNSVILVCDHCNKEGRGPAMKRWHFDRCRELV